MTLTAASRRLRPSEGLRRLSTGLRGSHGGSGVLGVGVLWVSGGLDGLRGAQRVPRGGRRSAASQAIRGGGAIRSGKRQSCVSTPATSTAATIRVPRAAWARARLTSTWP